MGSEYQLDTDLGMDRTFFSSSFFYMIGKTISHIQEFL